MFLVIGDSVLILNTEWCIKQSCYGRGELVGKGRISVVMGRTDSSGRVFPECLYLIGCRVGDDDLALTPCQDAYSKSMCPME